MVRIGWNPLEFHLVERLPKGRMLNGECCRHNPFKARITRLPECDGRKLVIHPNNTMNSHLRLMDYVKIWDFHVRNWRENEEVNHVELKSAIPMELEQRHIIKFLHHKGLKLDNVVTELPDMYGQDACAKLSIKYWFHQLRLGRKDLTTQLLGGRTTFDDTNAEILSILRRSPFS
jgi:hypothetical protein